MRLNGQTVTYTSPEQRSRLGIHLLPGGKGVFPEMTIAENLEMGGFAYRSDRADMQRRHRPGLRPVPDAGRTKGPASRRASREVSSRCSPSPSRSLHDPEVLMIDELSLGLAPIVVQELIRVVERLKRRRRDA